MTEREIKKSVKELSPIDAYMLLPRTNCKECGEANCMAFAAKLVNREVSIEDCPPILDKEHEKGYKRLKDMLAPAIKEIMIGTGDRAIPSADYHFLNRWRQHLVEFLVPFFVFLLQDWGTVLNGDLSVDQLSRESHAICFSALLTVCSGK